MYIELSVYFFFGHNQLLQR